jgi:hypothetical protein
MPIALSRFYDFLYFMKQSFVLKNCFITFAAVCCGDGILNALLIFGSKTTSLSFSLKYSSRSYYKPNRDKGSLPSLTIALMSALTSRNAFLVRRLSSSNKPSTTELAFYMAFLWILWSVLTLAKTSSSII